jgi:hypothetical protein
MKILSYGNIKTSLTVEKPWLEDKFFDKFVPKCEFFLKKGFKNFICMINRINKCRLGLFNANTS